MKLANLSSPSELGQSVVILEIFLLMDMPFHQYYASRKLCLSYPPLQPYYLVIYPVFLSFSSAILMFVKLNVLPFNTFLLGSGKLINFSMVNVDEKSYLKSLPFLNYLTQFALDCLSMVPLLLSSDCYS